MKRNATKDEIDKSFDRFAKSLETNEITNFSKKVIEDLKKTNRTDVSILISELEEGKFEDYHVNAYPFPKMELVDRLIALNLWELAHNVKFGKYELKENMEGKC